MCWRWTGVCRGYGKNIIMQSFYDHLFYCPDVEALFSAEAFLGYMLRFEKALAQAQAAEGVIPLRCAEFIEKKCEPATIELQKLARDAAGFGNMVIPLLRQLTDLLRHEDPESAGCLHLGVTSQDVIDTAMMIQVRDAVREIRRLLQELIGQLAGIAQQHKYSWMAARSFMQQARPISFGLKVTGWINPLLRAKHRLDSLLSDDFVLQLGGSAGSLYGLENAEGVTRRMCELLDLKDPGKPWHTERDRWAKIVADIGILSGSLGKIAQDITLLAQPEIGEVTETGREGGSSTLPQKRNPVKCLLVLSNTNRIPALVSTMMSCMGQDHERATGKWHAEWETISSVVRLCAGALHQLIMAVESLDIHKERMRKNLELTRGFVYAENLSLALARHIGKDEAHSLIEKLCGYAHARRLHLKEAAYEDPLIGRFLPAREIDRLFNPEQSFGKDGAFIDRVLSEINIDRHP